MEVHSRGDATYTEYNGTNLVTIPEIPMKSEYFDSSPRKDLSKYNSIVLFGDKRLHSTSALIWLVRWLLYASQ